MKKALQHFAILAIGFSLTCTTPLLGQGRYVRLQGKVLSQQPESNIHSFHLDAYKITKDGQRQLVRLSRFSGPDYHLYLEAEFDHEVLIQMMDHAPYLVKIDGVASGADQTERLVLNQDFIVPVNQPSGNAVASAKPKPPALPEAHITYLQVYEESGDLLEQWGDIDLVPPPALPAEIVETIPLINDVEILDEYLVFGGPVAEILPELDINPPPMPEEEVLPMVVGDEVPIAFDFGTFVVSDPDIQVEDQPSRMVATIDVSSAIDAPEHPVMLQSVADSGLPPAPRRARLKKSASIVVGLGSAQQERSIARLNTGQVIQVIEYTTPDWWMVSYGSVIGWVKAQYLD